MNEKSWRFRSHSGNRKSKTYDKPFGWAQDKLRQTIESRKSVALLGLAITFAMCGAAAHGHQARVPTIGLLSLRGSGYESFQRELRKLGYIEGKNIAIEFRSADNKLDRLPGLAHELVRLKVDVLFTRSTTDALAAKNATRTIPIVFISGSGDPVEARLVDSLARPGGNLTGFTTIAPMLAGKRLELLKETVPKLSRVAVLWDPQASSTQEWNESQLPARELGLQLYSMEVSRTDKFEGAFEEATKAGSGALAVTQNNLVNSNQKRITDLAAKNRLPAIYNRGDWVVSGGLMSYGADQLEPTRRAASLVDKILKGAKPADLPVEQPMKFELIINLKAAKQIGLKIPPNVLARADRVIR
jgi:putative tryptophan/tyrosine transport system substrate-binding protein